MISLAVLDKLPSQEIIDRYKGVIDFYYHKGTPCCRKWPHWEKRDPTPDEKAGQDVFAYATRAWSLLPSYLKEAYRKMAVSVAVTGRDIFTRAYINSGR